MVFLNNDFSVFDKICYILKKIFYHFYFLKINSHSLKKFSLIFNKNEVKSL